MLILSVLNNVLKTKAATTAKIIFEIGPAAATFTISFFGFSKYLESTGTGFAHPNPINNNANEPRRCLNETLGLALISLDERLYYLLVDRPSRHVQTHERTKKKLSAGISNIMI